MATALEFRSRYPQILDGIGGQLDISPSKYMQAVSRYKAVAEWLSDGDYEAATASPDVFPQGSFRLGTVVRPYRKGKECEYDIDLVCNLHLEKLGSSPEIVKKLVGARLAENAAFSKLMDEEGRRCWSMNYAEEDGVGFHLDVLPSTEEEQGIRQSLLASGIRADIAEQAIAITNRNGSRAYSWCSSNPGGYAGWFETVNRPALREVYVAGRQELFEAHKELFKSIDDVPAQLVKTPLQRAVQLLKRHRDVRFAGRAEEDDKPISMIITTLAAQAYAGEPDLHQALVNIVARISEYALLTQPSGRLSEQALKRNLIARAAGGVWTIRNPVNPLENFADRWHENGNRKARAFFEWVSWVQSDLIAILNYPTSDQMTERLSKSLGERVVKASIDSAMGGTRAAPKSVNVSVGKDDRTEQPRPWRA